MQLPTQYRSASIGNSYDASTNQVEVVWTTGAGVVRRSWTDGDYLEVLEVTPAAVRLGRLNSGAAFLNTHSSFDLADVIGSVIPNSARVSGGIGTARIQLSNAASDADVIGKIRDGIIRAISVGYRIHRAEKIEGDRGTLPTVRALDWEPLELSAVPIPADAGAMVRTRTDTKLFACTIFPSQLSSFAQAALRRMLLREIQSGL